MFNSGPVLTSTMTGICSVLMAPDVPDAPLAPEAPLVPDAPAGATGDDCLSKRRPTCLPC